MATKIEWSDETWNCVVGCTRASAGCDLVIESVNLIAQLTAKLIAFATRNLYPRTVLRVGRKERDKTRLLTLHTQEWQKHLAQHLRSLAEHLHAKLFFVMWMTAHVCLVMPFHCSTLEPFRQPLYQRLVSHGDGNNW